MAKKLSPIFIVGCQRSGTTLLRLMLTAHSQICIPPESNFALTDLYPHWHKTLLCHDTHIRSILDAIYANDKFPEWELDRELLNDRLLAHLPLTYAEFVNQIYLAYMESIGKWGQWGDKNPGYIKYLQRIFKLFPDAKVIHIIRDGRAVLSSNLRANLVKKELGLAPKFPPNVIASYRSWSRAIDSFNKVAHLSNCYQIRYEDLVKAPKKELEKLSQFVGVAFEEQMLRYHRKNKKRELVPAHRLPWHKITMKPPSKKRIDAWQEELSQRDKLLFELVGIRKLSTLGYDVHIAGDHWLAIDRSFLIHTIKSYVSEIYLSLPDFIKKPLKTLVTELSYTRNIRLVVAGRWIRETIAALFSMLRGVGSSERPQVIYMTGMPRTGTSLAKNYLGDYPGLETIGFQPRGFMFAWRASKNTDNIIVDKATHYIRNLNKIKRAYSNQVRYCCLIRDPRDELVSLLETSKHREIHRDKRFWHQWGRIYSGYLNFADKLGDDSRCYLLRYEDLVRWPVAAKEDFLNWLELDMKAEAITSEYRILNQDDIQDWKVEERKTISAKSVGRWKMEDDQERKELLNGWQNVPSAERLMRQMGYISGGERHLSSNLPGLRIFQNQDIHS